MALKDITHGMSNTRQYQIWCNMKSRCDNPSSDFYYRYGGRGISYDKSWSSFENFWFDMGEGYSDNLSLERLDNNSHYCKQNCVWIELKDQAKNRLKPSNNTSGNTGVSLHTNSIGKEYIRARWVDGRGKMVARYFSIEKYGEGLATELAIKTRKEALSTLGYSPNHGE